MELSYADEEKRKAEVAKVLSQIPVAKALGAGCMGSETTNMAKQPGISRKEAQEALLRSLGEILPACEEQGVLFAVECVYYHAMNTPEAVKMVLNAMASPNLRVICDFANYVGPENASVDAQRRLWDKVGSWYGDKIVAVHFKGQNFQPDGTLYSTSLEDSCVDYPGHRWGHRLRYRARWWFPPPPCSRRPRWPRRRSPPPGAVVDHSKAGGVQTLGGQLLHGAVLCLADDVGHLHHLGGPG